MQDSSMDVPIKRQKNSAMSLNSKRPQKGYDSKMNIQEMNVAESYQEYLEDGSTQFQNYFRHIKEQEEQNNPVLTRRRNKD